MPGTGTRARWLQALTLALPLVLLFVTAELGLRVLARESVYVPKPRLPVLADHYFLGQAPIPGSSYESDRSRVSVNSLGFRGPEFSPQKPPGTFRIFALGGSTTFGHFPGISSDATTYPARLEALLNGEKPDPAVTRYEVINAGVPGHLVRTSLQNLASRILFFDPDMIVVYHGTDDLARYGMESDLVRPLLDSFARTGLGAVCFDRLLGWSYAMQGLRYSLEGWSRAHSLDARPPVAEDDGAWAPDRRYPEAYRQDLRNLLTVASANGVRSMLIAPSIAITQETDFARLTQEEVAMRLNEPFPNQWAIPPVARFGMFGLYNEILREVAQSEGAVFVDANAAVPKTPEYHWDYRHLTDRGAALVAEITYQALRDNTAQGSAGK